MCSFAAQLRRALLGLEESFMGLARVVDAVAAVGALDIQNGRLVASLSEPMVSSKDFCGEGDVILGKPGA